MSDYDKLNEIRAMVHEWWTTSGADSDMYMRVVRAIVDRPAAAPAEQSAPADQTPRIPRFWWCPTHHLYRGGDERPCADAVKLGDDEALRSGIIAVLDSFDPNDWSTPTFAFEARRNFARIRALVELGDDELLADQEQKSARLAQLDQQFMAVRDVLLDAGQPEGTLSPIEVVERIDEIVNPDVVCPSCAGLGDVPCDHSEEQPVDEPRETEVQWATRNESGPYWVALDEQQARQRLELGSGGLKLYARTVSYEPWEEVQTDD